jgi:hypothetical protein
MYVIFPAVDVVDESYLSLVSQENENPPPTGLSTASRNSSCPVPVPPPTFHDTRPEQEAAEIEIARQNAAADAHVPVIPKLTQLQPSADTRDLPDSLYTGGLEPELPDLVPANLNLARRLRKVDAVIPMASVNVGPLDSQQVALGENLPPARPRGVPLLLRDLIHPALNEPIKKQQQVSFRLVKASE